jgi:hypothetical protein
MGWGWTWLGIPAVLAGCAAEPPPEPLYMWDALVGGVWCYRTIADPDCYPAPLPGEADRLIASGPNVYYSWRPNSRPRTCAGAGQADQRLSRHRQSLRSAWLDREWLLAAVRAIS